MNRLIFSILLLFSATLFVNAQGQGQGNGVGTGSGRAAENNTSPTAKNSKNKALRILSKPRPPYTEVARNNDVQGTVSLRVEFKKNGKIGRISIIKGLPNGLSEQATKAAEKIQFEPATKNGKKITVIKTVDYSFVLY